MCQRHRERCYFKITGNKNYHLMRIKHAIVFVFLIMVISYPNPVVERLNVDQVRQGHMVKVGLVNFP